MMNPQGGCHPTPFVPWMHCMQAVSEVPLPCVTSPSFRGMLSLEALQTSQVCIPVPAKRIEVRAWGVGRWWR